MNEIVVIDYGVGNLLSVKRGLEYCGVKAIITSKPEDIINATKIILPGVGAFKNAMQSLESLGLVKVIQEVANRKIDLLGICLGMQILSNFGEEFDKSEGLGLINGKVEKIDKKKNISHVGWNSIIFKNKGDLFKGIENMTDFYFVHAYKFTTQSLRDETSKVKFNNSFITSSIQKENIFGLQFHPEKSHKNGLKILKNFKDI